MSTLKDLTRNSVQSGLSASKWLSLCKLFVSKNRPAQDVDIGSELSKSVLVLFSDYPGDPTLQSYLKRGIQDGIISLATFVRTFLVAAKSPSMHNSSTLDMLCRIALDCHYSTGLDPIGSIVPFAESPVTVFETVHHALSLLKTAFELPSTHFHQLTTSASELLILLLTCVNDFTQLNTNQAVTHFAEDASDLLSQPSLSPDVKHVLEQFILSLSYLLGEDAKAAREAQMVHSTLGKSHAVVPNSDSDIVSCSLLLRSLVVRRVSEFGAGDGRRAVVLLIALVRSASWTPTAFYTQLLLSAVTCVAQEANNGVSTKSSLLWRAFVIGRLPHLISMFAQAVELEGVTASDWRQAMDTALASLLQEEDILAKCDLLYHPPGSEPPSQTATQHPFIGELLHQLLVAGIVDQAFASTLRTNLSLNELHPRIQSEAQEHASDVDTYIESKLGVDTSPDEIASLIEKIWQDSCSHAAFAEAVHKRFRSCASSLDIESLGHLCKTLYLHDFALEILSLHVKLSDLVAQALIILEDYDCETVGDPQTAVSHLGNLVLFLQITLSRYYLSTTSLEYGDRQPSPTLLNSAATAYRIEDMSSEDTAAFNTWHKALFDSGSEGIEDTILRSTRPKNLLRVAATLVFHAISMCAENKLDKDVLNNGISYFLGPLLNWTLVGVIKVLLTDIRHKSSAVPVHLQVEVLQTLLQSSSCPKPVLKLSAAAILRALPEGNTQGPQKPTPFDPVPIRQVALRALGVPIEEAAIPFSLDGRGADVVDYVKHGIREAFTSARAKKAPSLDIDRCLLMVTPTRFLSMLWAELTVVSSMGQLNICRRIATYVLSMPRSSRSPPLFPIFLHLTLPNLIAGADHLMPPEQAMTIELLVAVISSALTAALYVEWALLSVCKEKRLVLGQTALAMARRLGGDLRRKVHSPVSAGIAHRLTSNGQFMANFPTFSVDL